MSKDKPEIILLFTFFNFLLGLVYSGYVAIPKSNLDNKKRIVLCTIILDLPIWIATSTTIINLIEKGVLNYIPFGLFGLISVIVLLLVLKVFFNIIFDFEKLRLKKLKNN